MTCACFCIEYKGIIRLVGSGPEKDIKMGHFIASNLHRTGAAVSDEEWEAATKKFVSIIKIEGGWDIRNNQFHPDRPFKMVGFRDKVTQLGGRFVKNQYNEEIAVSFEPGPEVVEIVEKPFYVGLRAFKNSGVELPHCICNCQKWKIFADLCPFPKGSEERRGWFYKAACIGRIDRKYY